MCGLAGVVEPGGLSRRDLVRRMNDAIIHRGPDEDGYFEDEQVAMGMRRLSIQDVAHGHQPTKSEDGSVVVMLNGEIYNVAELQDLVTSRGHKLASHSDTEVIPHLYEEFGLDFVTHLRGMFAISLWDSSTQRFVLVRDRLGVKPLYFWPREQSLSYASELKALLVDERLDRTADPVAINHYLSYTYVPAPLSAVSGVHKLEPGHMLVWQNGQVATHRYWQLNYAPSGKQDPRSDEELVAELRERLIESVELRMISERPVGAFLSGGLDSSAVVGAMREAGVTDIKTFSIGFEEEKFNELPYARQVAERFQTDHHELIVKPEASDIVPLIATMFDEPYADSSAIPSWYLAEMARQHVVVALNGDGGDEALGGYQRYTISMKAPQVQIPSFMASAMQKGGAQLRRHASRAKPIDKASKAALAFAESTPGRRYARFVSYFREEEKLALTSPEFSSVVSGYDSYDIIEQIWNDHVDTDLINRLLATDTYSYLTGDLLPKVDITTMNVSLEARSPFLDHTFMEWAASIPGNRKIHRGSAKHLLKLALNEWLDEKLIHRTKMGFGIPLADWLRGPLRDLTYDVLTDQTAQSRGYFNQSAVRALLDSHMAGEDRYTHVYSLLMLELWHRQVLEQPIVSVP
jgi:asparagine synthase (glutamine-hydrolysing)